MKKRIEKSNTTFGCFNGVPHCARSFMHGGYVNVCETLTRKKRNKLREIPHLLKYITFIL